MPCPIDQYRVCGTTYRINALFTFISSLIYLFTPFKWVMALLMIEAASRGFGNPQKSPVYLLAGAVLRRFGVESRMINAGPKRFTDKLVALAALNMLVMAWVAPVVGMAIAGIIAVLSFVDTVFGYCVGCQVYAGWFAFKDRFGQERAGA